MHAARLPHSASSKEPPSPSSSFLLVYKENCRWTLERIYPLLTTASPPATDTQEEREPHKERQNTKTQQEYFHVHSSYIESQIVGPLADDMVARVAVIGHLKLEDVVASRSVSVLVEQNACTSTSCETDRPRHL